METTGPTWVSSKRGLIFKALSSLFLTSLIGGYITGKARSPKYDDPTLSPPFIRKVVRNVAFKSAPNEWTKVYDPDGRLKSFAPSAITLSFPCGVEIVSYDSKEKQIVKSSTSPVFMNSAPPRLGLSFNETLGFIVGGTQVYTAISSGSSFSSLVEVAPLSGRIALIFGGIVSTGSGFALGYYFGFDDRVKCGESVFQKLLSDAVFWEGVASDFVADHTWVFEYWGQFKYRPPKKIFDPAVSRDKERFVRVHLQSGHKVTDQEYLEEFWIAGIPIPVSPFDASDEDKYILTPESWEAMRDDGASGRDPHVFYGECLPESLRRIMPRESLPASLRE